MDAVVMERCIDPPEQIADLAARHKQVSWCMEQHRVHHVLSGLALDGRQSVCQFNAPDAEALRAVLRQIGMPHQPIWTSTLHGPPDLPVTAPLAVQKTLVVVERSFPEPADFSAIQAIEDRGAWCLEQRRVRSLRTYFSTDKRRMICLYEAPDGEAVRNAQLQAGMPLDRVWSADLYQSAAERSSKRS